MRLYDFARSSAAYRVRIALNLKKVAVEALSVHLRRNGGEQHSLSYGQVNPQNLVPTLDVNGAVLTQSIAIIEYLDEEHPNPPLLPGTALDRARIRAMVQLIAADIHPIQNLRVLQYLQTDYAQPEASTTAWARHWIEKGFMALEALVQRAPVQGRYCYGDAVTFADVLLVPQMNNARRFGCDMALFPHLVTIDQRLRALPEFEQAAPEKQPDFEA
ncbi:MAG: maleylacetoacetate isomerase [Rhodospirillaceae bacterium]|nr:maleylacetoacetate isomerase [Rhodospirillaceae bacterium]